MFSESDARKTRTVSICLIMLASALAPLAAPVSATTPEMPDLLILEINNNGTWEEMPEYTDPFIDGLMDEGTYEFRLTSMHLTTNDSYELEWSASVCDWAGDCDEPVEEIRGWTAMSDNSSETWNLTLGIMDCDVSITADLVNITTWDGYTNDWQFFGPCGNTGDITLAGDFDGDGSVDEIEGFDFDVETDLAVGNYDVFWIVDNLEASSNYTLEWMLESEHYGEGSEMYWEQEWSGNDPGTVLDWEFDILPWTCLLLAQAILGEENSTTGDIDTISAFYAQISGPCDSPIDIAIWNESSEEWDEISNIHAQAGPYEDCYWSDDDTRWWCGEDWGDDGDIEHEDWWYYCEESDMGWFCTDSFGQSEDHEFTENNTLLSPFTLESGTYDIRVNLTYLNDSTHYGVELHNLAPKWLEFNSTSDNYSMIAQLMVFAWDCDRDFGVAVFEDPDNANEPLMENRWQFMGPCEEMESPFSLTYDGMEWEMEYEVFEFEECTDDGYGLECWTDDDDDGEPEEYGYFWNDQCEWSDSDEVWYCTEEWGSPPEIEEGNHTMELLVDGLEIGENYTIEVDTEVCSMVHCEDYSINHEFNASAENETVTFHIWTDNYTCHADIHATLHIVDQSGESWHIFGEMFGFKGPCEEVPSPFSLTYDGTEWEIDYEVIEFEDCTDDGYGWDCYNDVDDDGEPDEYEWFEYDQCGLEGGVWYCNTGWGEIPHIEEGNHTMELLVEGLEIGEDYDVKIDMNSHNQWFGTHDAEVISFTASDENHTVTFHMETDNHTCGADIQATLFENDGNSLRFMGLDRFGFRGPCEWMPGPISLTYDGMEWEMDYYVMEFEDCIDVEGGWECTNDVDDDGEADDYQWFEFDQCGLEGGVWYCNTGWGDHPHIEEGNHTIEILVDYLGIGEEYELTIYTNVCQQRTGCDTETLGEEFTASDENHTFTFHMETDNYTCQASINVELYTWDEEGWRIHEFGEWFQFRGPCEEPPSNIDLLYEDESGDMVEWMEDYETMEYEDCTDDGYGWECMAGIDYNDDGEADDYEYHYYSYEDCDWSESDEIWYCEAEGTYPSIANGTFPMEWVISDLDDGSDYHLDWYIQGYSYNGGNYTQEDDWFTADTTGFHHIDWEMYVDSSYCSINIQAHLYHESEMIDTRYFGFMGECEMPSGPEMSLNIDVDGSWEVIEGMDMMSSMEEDHEEMEETPISDLLTYTIEDSGTHQMAWVLEDLEIEGQYDVSWNYMLIEMDGEDDGGYDSNSFEASQEEEIVEWELYVSESTCVIMVMGNAVDSDSGWPTMMAYYLAGPESLVDDDGDGESDCIAMMDSDMDGNHGGIPLGSENGHLDVGMEDSSGHVQFIHPYEQLSEGSYDMMVALHGLEEDCEDCYNVDGWVDSMGMTMMEMDDTISTDDHGEAVVDFTLEVNSWDCMLFIGVDLFEGDDDGDEWVDSYIMVLEGPCEGGSSEGLIDVALEDDGGNEHSLDEWVVPGEYSMNIDLSGLSGDDEYSIEWAHIEWVWGVRDVMDRLWSSDEYPFMTHTFTAGSDGTEQLTMELSVFESCSNLLIVDLYSGDVDAEDDDVEIVDSFYQFYETECAENTGFDLRDFETYLEFNANLILVGTESAVVDVYVDTLLHEEVRMAIDYEFGDGDGILNETEAMDFEEKFLEWGGDESDDSECIEQGPPFTLNGEVPECVIQYRGFVGLESDSMGAPIFFQGWEMIWNVSADDNGQLTLNFPGDPPDSEGNGVDATLCGGVWEETGMEIVSWAYNGTQQVGCVELMAGEPVGSLEIVFGTIADTDGDGVNDYDDRFPDDPNEWSDEDDDGVGDNSDEFPTDPAEWSDFDGDGVGDNGDAFPWDSSESSDSDGDGWGDNADAFPNDPDEWVDTDGDGTGDNADTDADGDGTDDTDEDSDGDGVNDDQDAFPFDANETADTDGDGVGDNADDFPDDPTETTDTDGDGTGDNSDDDADGDGTPNDLDDFPLNSGESTDSDGDGVGDSEDAFPNDANEYLDTDGDGIGDNADDDDDGDGTPDSSDAFPRDANETSDADGDGYGDGMDAFPNDAGEWSDYDGDGVGDNSDAFMSDPYESRDSDGDGTGDNADFFPNDPNEKIDTDGDGVGNNADAFPNDASESKDTDGDGIGDNADTDADGDGIPDEPVEDPSEDGGGGLPGFTAVTGLASVLGAAILVAGRRKD